MLIGGIGFGPPEAVKAIGAPTVTTRAIRASTIETDRRRLDVFITYLPFSPLPARMTPLENGA